MQFEITPFNPRQWLIGFGWSRFPYLDYVIGGYWYIHINLLCWTIIIKETPERSSPREVPQQDETNWDNKELD